MPKKQAAQPLNIILLGDPAAGKATQAAFLCKKHKLFDLDMGKELRRINKSSQGGALNKILDKTLDKGKLTPTKIVREIFKHRILSTSKKQGILFDGNPKMIGEAKLVYKLLQQSGRAGNVKVLYLSIPHEEIVKRMSKRAEYFKGKYSKRLDDNAQALRNRVSYYKKNITAVKALWRKIYGISEINGLGSISAVQKRIEQALKAKK